MAKENNTNHPNKVEKTDVITNEHMNHDEMNHEHMGRKVMMVGYGINDAPSL